jgi:alpha-tubulin suppressor-like RCC1 family protein
LVPRPISSTLAFANISAGIGVGGVGAHTCGVTTGGAVYCWGANAYGQAGTPQSTNPVTTPTQVSPSGFRSVSAGGEFTCGLRAVDGQIDCWGRNDYGQLGGGSGKPDATASPVRVAQPIMVGPNNTSVAVPGVTYTAVAAGRRHACALATDGWVYCWGSDVLGALGDQFQALTQNRPIRVYHAAP